MARCDAELREPRAGERDVDVLLVVALLAVVGVRLEQAEVLELAHELAADAGTPAQLGEVDAVLVPRGAERPRPPPLLAAGGRRELLPDHAQRQELVPLEAQDRLQPLDVLL